MEIQGQLTDIIYQNELNSYTVALFETEEEEMTVVGYLPFINSGDNLKLIGKFVTHQDYGRQFKIETFEKMMPQSLDALERYLANGTIKGIGPATAKKIITTFGEETMHVLKLEPERLAKIKGITKERAKEISIQFIENWDLWQIVGFLEKFGIGVQNAKNVYKTLGTNAIKEIEKNPYILIDVANNVDFKKIDKLALDIGIERTNLKRIKSGIKYALIRATYNGHTTVLKENLNIYVIDLLKVTQEDINQGYKELRAEEEIIIEIQDELEWVYLMQLYRAEETIARKILTLANARNIKYFDNIENEIQRIEKTSDIFLSEKQKEAINLVNDNNVCIITGGPGTGKTTIIKSIIELFKYHGKKPVLCAPTGRAAKRMTETTNQEAKTLHRLLQIGKIEEDNKIDSIEEQLEPIDGDIIIVDEMSMVDVYLMNYLVKALYQGTKLVLVGDVDQLPSVGPGSILKDLINSNVIETIVLNKIFRQAAQSKIILNSHRVNQGESFITKDDVEKEDITELKEDFFFINDSNEQRILHNIITLCKDRLKNYGDYDFFKNIQVLTPTKKGILGTKELNQILQDYLNPVVDSKKDKVFGNVKFRINDRVMQIKNNYDMFWEKREEKHETGTGVFNGELGTILSIDNENKQMKVKFDDDKNVWYGFDELEQLEHAYAITIHKAQGSEFDVVIMPITTAPPILMTRNLLYTGMTRAKKLLIIVGNPKVLDFMIKNMDTKKRNTGLEYKLKKLVD